MLHYIQLRHPEFTALYLEISGFTDKHVLEVTKYCGLVNDKLFKQRKKNALNEVKVVRRHFL